MHFALLHVVKASGSPISDPEQTCWHTVCQLCQLWWPGSSFRSWLAGLTTHAGLPVLTVTWLPHTRSHCVHMHFSVQGYVHRDVKPDNVFMAGDSALLGDFSLAVGPLAGSSSSAAGSLPSTPGRSRFSRCSNDSTTSLTPSSSGSLPESDAAASSADSESELGSVASLTASRCSSLLCRSFTVEGRCQAGGTPAYCAPEVVLAAFNSIPMSEALGPHVSSCRTFDMTSRAHTVVVFPKLHSATGYGKHLNRVLHANRCN